MHLKELKAKNPADLLDYAESLEIENASTLRKQDMMFACLKRLAEKKQSFGEEFIKLARNVYKLNDLRAEVKLQINKLSN